METLTSPEGRVLGVLIEKAMTTPDLYPLSVNALMNGCNQKNNRWPVMGLEEEQVFDAAEGLRGKGLVARVDQVGARTHKYKHLVGEKLNLRAAELAILAELLLRGPSTAGEVRGRASRMHELGSVEVVKGHLEGMMGRAEPLVRELGGGRGARYAQLLCGEVAEGAVIVADAEEVGDGGGGAGALPERVAALEGEVGRLKEVVRKLARGLGEGDPFAQ